MCIIVAWVDGGERGVLNVDDKCGSGDGTSFLLKWFLLGGDAGVRRAGGQDLDDRGFGQAAVKVLRVRRESRCKTADDKGMSGLELVETWGPFCPTGAGDPEHSHVPAWCASQGVGNRIARGLQLVKTSLPRPLCPGWVSSNTLNN